MKLESRHLTMLTPLPSLTRRRLRFTRKGNVIHLLETALVIEGYRQRFFMPVIDLFFRQALSEWTTVTVPYSRVLSCRYRGLWVSRLLASAVVSLPAVLGVVIVAAAGPGALAEAAYFGGLLALLSLILLLFLNLRLLAPRYHLLFRQADGRRALVSFRLRGKKRRQAFEAQLQSNRDAIREQVEQVAHPEEAASAWPLVVLGLFVVGLYLVAPLWEMSQRLGPPLPFFVYARVLVDRMLTMAPVILLAALLMAPRSGVLRWSAVGALLLRGAYPLLELTLRPPPPAVRPGGIPTRPPVPRDTDAEITAGLAALVFCLVLAAILALVRLPGTREEKA